MHTKFRSFRVSGFVIVFLFALLLSCKKDHRVLDTSVQPVDDKFSTSVVDSYEVRGYTIPHGEFISFGGRLKFLGTNIDPVFGRTEVGLYLNANFTAQDAYFASTATLVSAEFRIVVDQYRRAGLLSALQTFSVFPLDSALNPKRFYLASNDKLHKQTALPTTTVTSPVNGVDNQTLIIIPLDQAYAQQMILDHDAWKSNTDFQLRYPGFYILGSPSTGDGQIMYCDLNDVASGLVINYIDPTDVAVQTRTLTFTGDNAVKYNTVKHDYTLAAPGLKTQLGGDTSFVDYLYMQGLGGTKAMIEIPVPPYVSDSFALAISRAELILPADPSFTAAGYIPPPFLSLLAISSQARDSIVFDQSNATDNVRYDGKYDLIKNRYVFNIARHMQAIVKGQVKNRGFSLVVSDPDKSGTFFRDEYFERVLLGGPKHASLKPTFKLTYSKVSIR